MKLEFSRQTFEKKLKFQVSTKSVQWESSCSMRTDAHDEADSHFAQICEGAQKLTTRA
jgi:hypothetical protein